MAELKWGVFKELLKVLNQVAQSKSNGIDEGEFRNDNISAEWNEDGIEYTIEE